EDPVEVDAVLDADAVEQIQQVFGGDVARRPGAGERAAAQAARRAVEVAQPKIETGHDVSQRHAPRVVKVHAPPLYAGHLEQHIHEPRDVRRCADADRV